MTTKTLTIQFNDEQLPILPLEPKAHLSFATHDDGNELELTGNRAGLLLLAKAALGMAETCLLYTSCRTLPTDLISGLAFPRNSPPSGTSGGIDVGGALAIDETQNTDHSTE